MTTPPDESGRIDLAVAQLADCLRLLSSLALSPGCRHLKHARDGAGVPLFGAATAGGAGVLVCWPLVDVIRAVQATRPAVVCPKCGGGGCPHCRTAGYLPADPAVLRLMRVEFGGPLTEDVGDLWWPFPEDRR